MPSLYRPSTDGLITLSIITGSLALGYQGRAISGDGTAHVSVIRITTATRQGGGLVCVDTSRDTGPVPGVSLNWYRDGNKLQRQTSSSLQSYLGWSTFFEFDFQKKIWLKRDADTKATEGVLFCHLGRRDPFEATVSVGVYNPSECGYFLHYLYGSQLVYANVNVPLFTAACMIAVNLV